MPVGAIIGSAVVAGGTTLAASHAQSKATKAASQTAADSNAQSLALQKEAYNQNKAALAPWQQSGLQANSILTGALGFGGGTATNQQMPNVQAQFQGDNPDSSGMRFGSGLQSPFETVGGDPWGFNRPSVLQGSPGTMSVAQTPQQAANSAFDIYKGSTGYNFRVNEGMRALNGGYAGAGVLQSGAAIKGALNYGQNIASAEYNNWLASVGQVAQTGFNAASAQAGVSQTYANNASALNSQNAATQAQLQLQRGQNTANTIGALGQIVGRTAGSVFG